MKVDKSNKAGSEEPNRKRVLGVVGSPRRGGNTETLVDEVLWGAEEAGALTEKVILSELEIAPCRACDACRREGRCLQEDDMAELLERMQLSQVWVLGTPIYYWGPTAQFKAFIDRWYSADRAMFVNRRVILVMPLGGGKGTARYTLGMLTNTLNWQRTELFETILAPGAYSLGEVKGRKDVMTTARRAGRRAIETLKSTG